MVVAVWLQKCGLFVKNGLSCLQFAFRFAFLFVLLFVLLFILLFVLLFVFWFVVLWLSFGSSLCLRFCLYSSLRSGFGRVHSCEPHAFGSAFGYASPSAAVRCVGRRVFTVRSFSSFSLSFLHFEMSLHSHACQW